MWVNQCIVLVTSIHTSIQASAYLSLQDQLLTTRVKIAIYASLTMYDGV